MFLLGAGFYLNATNPKYSTHYNMRTHVTLELPEVLADADLPIVKTTFLLSLAHTYKQSSSQDLSCQSIFGHSMGGHGALTLYLSTATHQYRSASAFAPISNPIHAPWGQKAFAGYLQGGVAEAKEFYDATELIPRRTEPAHILVDYVRSPVGLASAIILNLYLCWFCRALQTSSTKTVSCCLRTSSRQRAGPGSTSRR